MPVPVYEVKRLLRKAKSIDVVVEIPSTIKQAENITSLGGTSIDVDLVVIDEIITLVKAQQSIAFIKILLNELQKMVVD